MMESRQGIIYALRNKLNGKIYVGQTVTSFQQRLNVHLYGKQPIDYAIRKYGIDGFEIFTKPVPEERIDDFECNLISLYDSIAPNGYNLRTGGHKGHHASEELKKKFSDMRKGEKHPQYGRRGKDAIWYGKHHSEETKKKMRDAQTGEKNHMHKTGHSLEAKQQISEAMRGEKNPFFGKHHSDETKRILSEHSQVNGSRERGAEALRKSAKERIGTHYPPRSIEHRRKLSEAGKGRIVSEETRRKLSIAGKKRIFSEKCRQQWARARRLRWAGRRER